MDFGADKTPIEEIERRGTYLREIHSGVTGKWYKKSWKKVVRLKNIDQKYY